MGFTELVVIVVVLGACLVGGLAVLLRISLERDRLVKRYSHIKAVMEYEEQLRARQEEKQSSVAQRADFVADPADLHVASPESVAEPIETVHASPDG